MVKKISAILIFITILLSSIPAYAQGSPCAEIFDTRQKSVLKAVQVNSEIYDMVAGWVRSIDNFYGRISPVAIDGYKVRIPLDPPVKLNKKSLSGNISEVYIVVPPDRQPFFIIYEDRDKPSFFKFHGNIDSLSKALEFKLRN
ncbi:hypothetical protein HMPREF1982_00626 [Clostridiales bacterium oral taxon 876 str. F0540]|nr:hypothetical protein HMPREF1982_00626 [Clostridiales bacterium oral taxon 876 str. F0540]